MRTLHTGISVDLTDPSATRVVTLATPPLWTGAYGPVIEVVFYGESIDRAVHLVAEPFDRELPAKHLQLTLGDIAWVSGVVARKGEAGLRACVLELEAELEPVA